MAEREVRVFVGTDKGTYVARSSYRRRRWRVAGPFTAGMDVYHAVADPRRPSDVYSLANSPWFGPVLYRSRDGGRRWKEVATPGLSPRRTRKPPFSDSPAPVQRLWHLEAGPQDQPGRLYLGAEPHRLFRSDDSGESWTEEQGIARHPTRKKWMPGGGGACLHTILIDPTRPERMYVGMSAAGTFRSDDGGRTWAPKNRGVRISFAPDHWPEVGHCVHHVALDAEDPRVAYRQDHDGMYLSEDSMDRWTRIGRPLETDFGFVVATAPALPGGAIFAPLQPPPIRTMPGRRLQLWWFDRAHRKFRPMIRRSAWTGEFGNHREGLAVDRLDPAGIYFGTTGGQLIFSPDGGKSWGEIPFHFPRIHSVTASLVRPAS